MMTGIRLPNLLIPGVGKAGTTSLFWYLSQHPDVCAAAVKEPRYFAPLMYGEPLLPLAEYQRLFTHCGSERYVMDGSPQYFQGGPPIITAIKEVLGTPRAVIILRNPIDRVWSLYRFMKMHLTLPRTAAFEPYIDACERVLLDRPRRTRENDIYWALAGSCYVEYLTVWLDNLGDDALVLFFERLTADPRGTIADVIRWLDLDDSVIDGFDFRVENRTEMFRSKLLQRIALAMNSERLLRQRRWLKRPLRSLYYTVNRSRRQEGMSQEARDRLEEVFQEPNRQLLVELRRRGYKDFPAWLLAGEMSQPPRTETAS
jgi:hypothetical protein